MNETNDQNDPNESRDPLTGSLEKELRQCSAPPVSAALRAKLAAALATPSLNSPPLDTPAHLSPPPLPHLSRRPSLSFSDRCLVTAMTLGALAAGLIITLLTLDAAAPHAAPPLPSQVAQIPPLTPAGYQRLLAELTNTPEKPPGL